MDVLVHSVRGIDAINNYQYLIKKLTILFSDLMSSRKTEYGYTIDIFNVHVVFRYGPLESIIECRPPEYYYSDNYEVRCYLLQESCKTIPHSKALASLDMLYYVILQKGRKLQYSINYHSLELRFKLLNIAQKHNFNLLFSKYEQHIGNEYRAIFINDKQEEYKVSFDISCCPDLNAKCFQDLEERIVRYLGNGGGGE